MILTYPRRVELIVRIPIFCRIEPLKRPRVVYHTRALYQPIDNQKNLRETLRGFTKFKVEEPVLIDTTINFRRATTSKLHSPSAKNHGDEDNLRKAINDALVSAGILLDDSLVMGGTNTKAFGSEDMALIEIWTISDTMAVRDVV